MTATITTTNSKLAKQIAKTRAKIDALEEAKLEWFRLNYAIKCEDHADDKAFFNTLNAYISTEKKYYRLQRSIKTMVLKAAYLYYGEEKDINCNFAVDYIAFFNNVICAEA